MGQTCKLFSNNFQCINTFQCFSELGGILFVQLEDVPFGIIPNLQKQWKKVKTFWVFWVLGSTRFLCPWNSPGKNTGVDCHSLLQWSSWPRDRTCVSRIAGRFFTVWATREALKHDTKYTFSIFLGFWKCYSDFPFCWKFEKYLTLL